MEFEIRYQRNDQMLDRYMTVRSADFFAAMHAARRKLAPEFKIMEIKPVKKTPTPEFAAKLAHAAFIRRNWNNGMKYSQANLDAAFVIIRTAQHLGYNVPSGEVL